MKTVLINGGLGNQVFQYIFGRTIELVTGEKVVFDDAYFFSPMHHIHSNGTSAQRLRLHETFGIDISLLSQTLDNTAWQEALTLAFHPQDGKPHSIPEFLRTNYPALSFVAETSDFVFDGPVLSTPTCVYNPAVYKVPTPTYYHGYWINKGWLSSYKDILLKELTFRPITEPHNLAYAQQIDETNSVALHIRKFSLEGYNWDLSPEFYRQSILSFTSLLQEPTFFIFSDSLDYCKSSYKELGLDLAGDRIIFVEGNESDVLNYRDMQLMSLCKHMIIANSSFSYLAALLNPHQDKLVANPTNREI